MKHTKTRTIKSAIILISALLVFTLYETAQAKKDLDNGRENLSQWGAPILKERAQKDEEFKTSPTSPMAAKKRLLVQTGQAMTYVVEKDEDIVLSTRETAGTLFALEEQKGQWSWRRRAPGVVCIAGGKHVQPGSPLPPQTEFRLGCCLINVYPSKDGLVLIVYDPLRPQIQNFSHLLYFPPDPEFAVRATLKKFDKIEKVIFPTSQKLEKVYYRYAAVQFKLKGKDLQLSAFKSDLDAKDDSASLFIPFADATSGNETYEVGRFLEIPEPKDSTFILDFNRCFNPLCNYSPAYNCPIPPRENFLDIPITAGEKLYSH